MRNRKQRRFVATSAGNLQHTPNWGAGLPTGVDPLNFAAVKLQPFYNDIQLGNATGFFYFGFLGSKPNFWLVTNWHVLSGRNAEEPESVLHKMGSVPNRLRLSLLLEFDQPKYTSNPNAQILFQEQFIELYDKEGRASWYQHVKKSAIDVAVLNASVFVGRFHLVGINSAGTDADMAIQIGSQIFILGYPHGINPHALDWTSENGIYRNQFIVLGFANNFPVIPEMYVRSSVSARAVKSVRAAVPACLKRTRPRCGFPMRAGR